MGQLALWKGNGDSLVSSLFDLSNKLEKQKPAMLPLIHILHVSPPGFSLF